MTDMRQPTDDQLWLCMSETMRNVILPRLEDPWARAAMIRLIGLAEYAPKRGTDPTQQRTAALIACIDNLISRFPALLNQLPEDWPSEDAGTVMSLSSSLLEASVGDSSDQAEAIRSELKTLLLAQLDDDLSASSPLIASFMGELNDK